MTTQLAAEQQALLRAVWAGDNQNAMNEIANFAADKTAPTQRGLNCYRANGLALAQRALPVAYPVLAQLLGEESFAALAADFWQQQPPVRGDIAQWGAALPAFVQASEQLADVPYLADVAEVEWALHCAATAADAEVDLASLQLLAQADPATLTLVLGEPAICITSEWPVVSIVNAHRLGQPPLEEIAQRLRANAQTGARVGECAFIWRQGLRPMLREAQPGEADFIAALQRGSSLLAALQASPPLDFNQWLVPAVQTALLTGVRTLDSTGVFP
ncbi:MAG: DNA-binding domain-containing protein [Pseudomonadota bacterium]